MVGPERPACAGLAVMGGRLVRPGFVRTCGDGWRRSGLSLCRNLRGWAGAGSGLSLPLLDGAGAAGVFVGLGCGGWPQGYQRSAEWRAERAIVGASDRLELPGPAVVWRRPDCR